jgi:hypothetical protein
MASDGERQKVEKQGKGNGFAITISLNEHTAYMIIQGIARHCTKKNSLPINSKQYADREKFQPMSNRMRRCKRRLHSAQGWHDEASLPDRDIEHETVRPRSVVDGCSCCHIGPRHVGTPRGCLPVVHLIGTSRRRPDRSYRRGLQGLRDSGLGSGKAVFPPADQTVLIVRLLLATHCGWRTPLTDGDSLPLSLSSRCPSRCRVDF